MSQKLMLEWRIFIKALLLSLTIVSIPDAVYEDWYYPGWKEEFVSEFTKGQWLRINKSSQILTLMYFAILAILSVVLSNFFLGG